MKIDKYTDYWSIFFGIISLIFTNLAIFIPTQRVLLFSFTLVSLIFAIVLYYITKIKTNENSLNELANKIDILSKEILEKFNYLKEIYNIKLDVEMLKKNSKKAQINLLDLIKVAVAIVLIYVIVQVIKTLL